MLKKTAIAVLISGFSLASFAANVPVTSTQPATHAAKEHKAGTAGTSKHKHEHHKKESAKAETSAAPSK